MPRLMVERARRLVADDEPGPVHQGSRGWLGAGKRMVAFAVRSTRTPRALRSERPRLREGVPTPGVSSAAYRKAVEDEHRLLSQVLLILHSYRQLPADLLEGRLGLDRRGVITSGLRSSHRTSL